MARQTRRERRGTPDRPVEAPQPEMVPYRLKETMRYRCPCCGMMPFANLLDDDIFREYCAKHNLVLSEEGVLNIQLWSQRMGGRRPSPPGTRDRQKSAPGNMFFTDVSEERPEELAAVTEAIMRRIAAILRRYTSD